MKIKAAVLQEPHRAFQTQDLEVDISLRSQEVLVKILATGLCHTDLSVRDQHIPARFPVVLGHEGAGVVVSVAGDVENISQGDRVVLAPSSCGKCHQCLSGHPSYCSNIWGLNLPRGRADGTFPYQDHSGNGVSSFFFGQSSFGSYSLTSSRNIVKVPDDVPLEILGPLGCGLQTGAGTVLNVLRPGPGESIVVFGAGPVGLAALMAAKASGCAMIVAVDIHDTRLALAKQLGATHVINSGQQVVSEFIKSNLSDEGLDFSIDTTGRNEVINQAVGSLRPMGKCALVAVPSLPKLEVEYAHFNSGRSLIYVNEGDSIPQIFIPRLIKLYQQGLFPFDKLIKFYELDDINQAVADSENGVTLKAVIKMPQ